MLTPFTYPPANNRPMWTNLEIPSPVPDTWATPWSRSQILMDISGQTLPGIVSFLVQLSITSIVTHTLQGHFKISISKVQPLFLPYQVSILPAIQGEKNLVCSFILTFCSQLYLILRKNPTCSVVKIYPKSDYFLWSAATALVWIPHHNSPGVYWSSFLVGLPASTLISLPSFPFPM